MIILGYALAVIMGLTLGLIGAGGSILTVPILVYLLGVKPVVATGYSLLVVGSAALTGATRYWHHNLVNFRAALIFSTPAMLTVLAARTYIVPGIPDPIAGISKDVFIMLLFSAHDVGWIKELTVDKIMRTGVKTVPSNMALSDLRKLIPAGSTARAFVIDGDEFYKGVIDVAALYMTSDLDADSLTAIDFARGGHKFLLPSYDIQKALSSFTDYELEELPVLESQGNPKIVGYVTESYALKRYTQELESHNLMQYGLNGINS